MAGIQHKPVGVFWDIENCSIPKNKSPSDVIAHIRNFFVINRLNHREYEFIISCDVTRLRKDIPDDINKAGGVTLAHVNGSSKNAADEKLRENMKKFVDTHASSVSPVLILISGDIDFVNDLRGYQTRLGCTVILIHATNCSSQLKVGWNEIYCFTNFCSAVKDNPAPVANSITLPKKQSTFAGPNQKNQGGPPNQKNNQGGPPEARFKHNNDPKTNRQAQAVNKTEKPQKTTESIQVRKEARDQNQTKGGTLHPQQYGSQFGQGCRSKSPNNRPGNGNQKPSQFQPNNFNGSGNPAPINIKEGVAKDAAEKPANNKFILMVGGLPGKMDFKILKENLQLQANKVYGKVKYVKNGQAFITFNHKSNADRAVELFNGKKVYGKTLNVSFTKAIPFEVQADGKPKSGPDGFAEVGKGSATTTGYQKSKSEDGNSASSLSNGHLGNDPVLAGLGSIIGGIVASRIAAAKPGNKSPDSCPIQ